MPSLTLDLVGRSSTTAPVAEPASSSPGLLGTIGTVLGSAIGQPAIGSILGTIGDAVLGTGTSSTPTPGRAQTTTATLTDSQRLLGFNIEDPGTAVTVSGRRKMPPTNKVRRLVRLVGVLNASEILGLTVPATALIATRPYRRRGISAAALRVTRRTIRAVNSINRSLACVKSSARRRC